MKVQVLLHIMGKNVKPNRQLAWVQDLEQEMDLRQVVFQELTDKEKAELSGKPSCMADWDSRVHVQVRRYEDRITVVDTEKDEPLRIPDKFTHLPVEPREPTKCVQVVKLVPRETMPTHYLLAYHCGDQQLVVITREEDAPQSIECPGCGVQMPVVFAS